MLHKDGEIWGKYQCHSFFQNPLTKRNKKHSKSNRRKENKLQCSVSSINFVNPAASPKIYLCTGEFEHWTVNSLIVCLCLLDKKLAGSTYWLLRNWNCPIYKKSISGLFEETVHSFLDGENRFVEFWSSSQNPTHVQFCASLFLLERVKILFVLQRVSRWLRIKDSDCSRISFQLRFYQPLHVWLDICICIHGYMDIWIYVWLDICTRYR